MMLKLLNKLVLGECSRCKRKTMVRERKCDESGEMSQFCVMCVPVDSTDMGYQKLATRNQQTTSLRESEAKPPGKSVVNK